VLGSMKTRRFAARVGRLGNFFHVGFIANVGDWFSGDLM